MFGINGMATSTPLNIRQAAGKVTIRLPTLSIWCYSSCNRCAPPNAHSELLFPASVVNTDACLHLAIGDGDGGDLGGLADTMNPPSQRNNSLEPRLVVCHFV
jgi:hypothetical protein